MSCGINHYSFEFSGQGDCAEYQIETVTLALIMYSKRNLKVSMIPNKPFAFPVRLFFPVASILYP